MITKQEIELKFFFTLAVITALCGAIVLLVSHVANPETARAAEDYAWAAIGDTSPELTPETTLIVEGSSNGPVFSYKDVRTAGIVVLALAGLMLVAGWGTGAKPSRVLAVLKRSLSFASRMILISIIIVPIIAAGMYPQLQHWASYYWGYMFSQLLPTAAVLFVLAQIVRQIGLRADNWTAPSFLPVSSNKDLFIDRD